MTKNNDTNTDTDTVGIPTGDELDDPRGHLRDAGITTDEIRDFEGRIDATVQSMLADYDEYVTLTTTEEIDVVVAVQDALIREVVEIAVRGDSDIPTVFENIADDLADPDERTARSSVSVALGKLVGDPDAPDSARMLANGIMERNYADIPGLSHD